MFNIDKKLLKWFKRKRRDTSKIEIVDKRKNKRAITPVKGGLDPVRASMIAACMQGCEPVFGQFDGKKLEIDN